MNERIRELADQADAWYPQGYPSAEGGDEAWKNLVIFEKEDLQKFAELIVRECANIDFRFKVGMTTDQESDTGRVILEHFGVK